MLVCYGQACTVVDESVSRPASTVSSVILVSFIATVEFLQLSSLPPRQPAVGYCFCLHPSVCASMCLLAQ